MFSLMSSFCVAVLDLSFFTQPFTQEVLFCVCMPVMLILLFFAKLLLSLLASILFYSFFFILQGHLHFITFELQVISLNKRQTRNLHYKCDFRPNLLVHHSLIIFNYVIKVTITYQLML